MYWRVRKYTPEELLRLYGVHIALAVSVFLNFILIVTRPNLSKSVSAEVKADFDAFARKVTQHILDTSWITYENSTTTLISPDNGELAPNVVKELQNQVPPQLPRNINELKATAKTYMAQKRVSAVRIDEVTQKDADNRGLVAVDVTGVVAVHSAEEAGPDAVHFHFRYLLGFRPNTQIPLVAKFQDLSPSN